MKVYLATKGEYSDYDVVHVFAREEDADAYPLADRVEEYELHQGPVDCRYWHSLEWYPERPDSEPIYAGAAYAHTGNPWEFGSLRDYDAKIPACEHTWGEVFNIELQRMTPRLNVRGWDLDRVRKVYSEQRAQFIASGGRLES